MTTPIKITTEQHQILQTASQLDTEDLRKLWWNSNDKDRIFVTTILAKAVFDAQLALNTLESLELAMDTLCWLSYLLPEGSEEEKQLLLDADSVFNAQLALNTPEATQAAMGTLLRHHGLVPIGSPEQRTISRKMGQLKKDRFSSTSGLFVENLFPTTEYGLKYSGMDLRNIPMD